ncbi:hypothetical protein P7D22_19715 [Lichenihabitans sp. Uapishka_5]|uniref:hypothetical protein n=1 Tax=Lichenihabitans sp. Uapishka_5 TaxID=3037302 RepID=UPI0029E81B96|nr:hypothetical protein [Lichenihabitans sp. Uapishka_5]MDX7953396.1 hypothetical protein [Lichenihabitans sp. Uapishka_5]
MATARAIGRTLKSAGSDWHDLARQIEHYHENAFPPPRRERREREPRSSAISAESLRLLREGRRLDVYTTWELGFVDTILTAADRPRWHPSRKQIDIVARLIGKAQDAEVHR